MSDLRSLNELEERLNTGSVRAMILGLPIQKGMVGQQNQYKFVVNSDDHLPPHFHVSLHNQQIAKYDLVTGEPLSSRNPKLNKFVSQWLGTADNLRLVRDEWERCHGAIN